MRTVQASGDLRLAVVGNGGVGKSVIAGTLARLLARQGRRVLAVDLDPNPGLAFSLGLPVTDSGLPPEAVEERDDRMYGWGLARHLDPSTAAEQFALTAPDGVRYLSPGGIDRPDHLVSHSAAAVREILAAMPSGWDVIADVEAGTTTPAEGTLAFAQTLVAVVTSARKSALAARRITWLLPALPVLVVAGQDQGGPRGEGFEPHVRVPRDPAVADAEEAGLAPLDTCPDSPVIGAVGEIAQLLLSGRALA
ncbi:MAG: AAA family ATPase [Actinobacteria bacterium]|nr:AAA family ATPase [Actinomycetota bacterium]